MTPSFRSQLTPLAICLFLTGCSVPTTPDIALLRLTLDVTPATLVEGSEVQVVLTMRNRGSRAVLLTGSSSCPPFGFQIVGSAMQPSADPARERICTADYREWNVQAGGTLVHSFRWTGGVQHPDGRTVLLPAGQYQLVGVVVGPPNALVTSEPVSIQVEPGAVTQ